MTSKSSKQKLECQLVEQNQKILVQQQQQRLMLQQKQQQLSLNTRQAISDNIPSRHSRASAPFAVGMKDLLNHTVFPEFSATSSERKHGCKTPEHAKSSEKFKIAVYPSYLKGDSEVVLEDSTLAGELSIKAIPTKEQEITWNISRFLNRFWRERKKIASPKFSFANMTWHFCFSMDSKNNHSLFAINVLTHSSSDPECDFYCSISFLDVLCRVVKNIKCEFKCKSAHCTVTDFLSSSEIDNFEGSGANIVCRIRGKNSSIKETCSQTEISYFTHTAVETQTQLPENAELPMPGFDYTVLQDFKNLCLNGEGSDVTLQVGDQQFKAHRSFLTARSSVFAAMFNCDMKEKATGIVNVEDCELSSFPVFLEYLYCGSTEKLSSENVFHLYVSADKYDVQDLKRKCLEFMKSNLSVNTFCETLQIALQHSETDLLKLATEFFIRNLQDIILTTKWQTFIIENPIQGNELFIKAAKTFR